VKRTVADLDDILQVDIRQFGAAVETLLGNGSDTFSKLDFLETRAVLEYPDSIERVKAVE
jgi:hypothetical protein